MIPSKNELLPYKNNRKQAAKFFKVTEKTIVNWMKKYEIYEPKQNYGCNKLDMTKAVEIRNLYKEGYEIKNLAKKYQVSFSTISRIIHNFTYKEFENTALVNVVYNVKQIGPVE